MRKTSHNLVIYLNKGQSEGGFDTTTSSQLFLFVLGLLDGNR